VPPERHLTPGSSAPSAHPTGLVRALELAYRHLGRRERTVQEVRRHLERREVDPVSSRLAIAELCELGVLDDRRYARAFAEDKRELEGWGSERIRRALLERGIERELVEVALACAPHESERERALTLLRRRFPAGLQDARARARALGLLVRRGYESELAYETVRAWGGAEEV
jgi:regulatory protein